MIMLRGCYILPLPPLTVGTLVLHGVQVTAGEPRQKHRRYNLYSEDRDDIKDWAKVLQEMIAYRESDPVAANAPPNASTSPRLSSASASFPRSIAA